MLTDEAQAAFRQIVERDPDICFTVVAAAVVRMTGICEDQREFILQNILQALEYQRET